MDEVADMPETLFPEIIRPALSDRKGSALFIGTPRGHNAFFDLYEAAKNDKDWFTAVFKASETGIVDMEELEAAKTMMSQDQFDQEFECSWVANVPGAIYGKEMQKALEEGRITVSATARPFGLLKVCEEAALTLLITMKRAMRACLTIARCFHARVICMAITMRLTISRCGNWVRVKVAAKLRGIWG
jgi:hypothetical protein